MTTPPTPHGAFRMAVLMTCHNRRDTTLACLRALAGQSHFHEADLYLVDDGCTDGTAEAVRRMMPDANILEGDGTLYWNGGMNRAWEAAEASETEYTHVLWLNDDVLLHSQAIECLVRDASSTRPDAIIVGATQDAGVGGRITYGGQLRPKPGRPLRFNLMCPSGAPQMADTLSGNVVLVPQAASRELGHLDPAFRHIYGDLDYGLRARRAGIQVMLAGEVVGTCEANAKSGSWYDDGAPLHRQLVRRARFESSIHARDWRTLVRKWDGSIPARVRHAIAPYARILAGRPNRHAAHIMGAEAAR